MGERLPSSDKLNTQPCAPSTNDLKDKVVVSLAIHQQRLNASVALVVLCKLSRSKHTTPIKMAREQGGTTSGNNKQRHSHKTVYSPRTHVSTGISHQGSTLHTAPVQHFREAVCVRSILTSSNHMLHLHSSTTHLAVVLQTTNVHLKY